MEPLPPVAARATRIACVRYLNTAPLIFGLDKMAGPELVATVPSRIGEMVAGGKADVGLVSLVDTVTSSVPMTLLPVGMIGCDGPTLTVRVFSDVPFEEVTELHADTDSRTSVALCRLLLKERFGVSPKVVPFDAREGVVGEGAGRSPAADLWPTTLLVIGDKVVTHAPPTGRYRHQLDLGEAWKELTGQPFVYAVWACREGEAEEGRIRAAADMLDRLRRRNSLRLDWIAARQGPAHRWSIPEARRYLTELLRYEVGGREREAAELFVREASRAGLLAGPGMDRAALRWHADLPALV